jgi:hypothetical protein
MSDIVERLRSLVYQEEWLEEAAAEIERLRVIERAAVKTIEDNAHLADGDNCTLIALKRALAGLEQKLALPKLTPDQEEYLRSCETKPHDPNVIIGGPDKRRL